MHIGTRLELNKESLDFFLCKLEKSSNQISYRAKLFFWELLLTDFLVVSPDENDKVLNNRERESVEPQMDPLVPNNSNNILVNAKADKNINTRSRLCDKDQNDTNFNYTKSTRLLKTHISYRLVPHQFQKVLYSDTAQFGKTPLCLAAILNEFLESGVLTRHDAACISGKNDRDMYDFHDCRNRNRHGIVGWVGKGWRLATSVSSFIFGTVFGETEAENDDDPNVVSDSVPLSSSALLHLTLLETHTSIIQNSISSLPVSIFPSYAFERLVLECLDGSVICDYQEIVNYIVGTGIATIYDETGADISKTYAPPKMITTATEPNNRPPLVIFKFRRNLSAPCEPLTTVELAQQVLSQSRHVLETSISILTVTIAKDRAKLMDRISFLSKSGARKTVKGDPIATTLLCRVKTTQGVLDSRTASFYNICEVMGKLEASLVDLEVVAAFDVGTKGLKEVLKKLDIAKVDETMEGVREALEECGEVERVIMGDRVDLLDVEQELERMVREEENEMERLKQEEIESLKVVQGDVGIDQGLPKHVAESKVSMEKKVERKAEMNMSG